MFDNIKEINGKFKVFLYKEWCFMCEWNEEKQKHTDCVFDTREAAELAYKEYIA